MVGKYRIKEHYEISIETEGYINAFPKKTKYKATDPLPNYLD